MMVVDRVGILLVAPESLERCLPLRGTLEHDQKLPQRVIARKRTFVVLHRRPCGAVTGQNDSLRRQGRRRGLFGGLAAMAWAKRKPHAIAPAALETHRQRHARMSRPRCSMSGAATRMPTVPILTPIARSTAARYKSRATRNPTRALRVSTLAAVRNAERTWSGSLPHEPPRTTRRSQPGLTHAALSRGART